MSDSLYEKIMKEGIEDIKLGARRSMEASIQDPHPYPQKWDNKYPPITSLQLFNKCLTTSLVPWSNEEIKTATVVYSLTPGVDWTPQVASAFSAGIRCREKPDTPKPFPAAGAWFPVDILGSPMIEVKPGHYQAASILSTEQISSIVDAFTAGSKMGMVGKNENPHTPGSNESEAWILGYVSEQ